MRERLLAMCLAGATWLFAGSAPSQYRVLLVVDHWSDPASALIDAQKDRFQPVAALLKAWSVPFDILRLDQQVLSSSYLFERDGKPRYGTVLWVAGSSPGAGKRRLLLNEAFEAGSNLIVAGANPLDPALEQILGLKSRESFTADAPAQFPEQHFITRDLAGNKAPLILSGTSDVNRWVDAQGAAVLVSQAGHPLVTIRQAGAGSSAIWLGIPQLARLRDVPAWRAIFFRSLTWSLGYLVTPAIDYSRRLILEFDDWGTADKGFLSYWRYPTLDETTIERRIISPLVKRQGIVVANVITGYVDRETKRVITPWTQRFTDRYGVLQDYGSTRRGLIAAVRAGVLEIESHGWTHMQPDLDSPPGPWWTADLAGEASTIPWYEEFLDRRRDAEIPAHVQLFHMKRSIAYLREDFDVQPLTLRPGGAAWSGSWLNHTGRVAAQAGFGLFHAGHTTNFYLDRDLVLDMAGIAPEAAHAHDAVFAPDKWPSHPDGPVILTVHDRDIALQPDFLERTLDALPPGYKTLSMNQYVAVLHTTISSAGPGEIVFDFDEHYCRFFKALASSWQLWLADPLRKELGSTKEMLPIDVPPGLGTHRVRGADAIHD